jgi:hypothetical protein
MKLGGERWWVRDVGLDQTISIRKRSKQRGRLGRLEVGGETEREESRTYKLSGWYEGEMDDRKVDSLIEGSNCGSLLKFLALKLPESPSDKIFIFPPWQRTT